MLLLHWVLAPSGDVRSGPADELGLDGCFEGGEAVMVEGVPHPLPSPLAVDQAGLAEDLEVVRDGALGLAQGTDELANADLPRWRGSQHGQHPQADWIPQGVEAPGQLAGLVSVEGSSQHRRAALDRLDPL